MTQKEKFLEIEGNGWFQRNIKAIESRNLPNDDPVLTELLTIKDNLAGGGQ